MIPKYSEVPSKCQDCLHMGAYGHGEPPDCWHPNKGKIGPFEFANPRSTPPDWCPIRVEVTTPPKINSGELVDVRCENGSTVRLCIKEEGGDAGINLTITVVPN